MRKQDIKFGKCYYWVEGSDVYVPDIHKVRIEGSHGKLCGKEHFEARRMYASGPDPEGVTLLEPKDLTRTKKEAVKKIQILLQKYSKRLEKELRETIWIQRSRMKDKIELLP